MKIADIQSLPDDKIVEGPISGTIKVVFDKKEDGPYGASQGIVVLDDSGEIIVEFQDKGPFFEKTDMGKKITMSSKVSTGGPMKGQWVGLKVKTITGGKNAGKKKIRVGAAVVTLGGSQMATYAPSTKAAPGTPNSPVSNPAPSGNGHSTKDKTISFVAAAKVWSGIAKEGSTPEDCYNWVVRFLELLDAHLDGGIEGVANSEKEKAKKILDANEDPF